MVRFNELKIYVPAAEAKPGGNIGAMLSPYLFSTNMSTFCKRFNEQTKDYSNIVWVPVVIHCDVVEKTFTFFIKPLSITMFIINLFAQSKKLNLLSLFDIIKYISAHYRMSIYYSSIMCFAILRSFKRRKSLFDFSQLFIKKIGNLRKINAL